MRVKININGHEEKGAVCIVDSANNDVKLVKRDLESIEWNLDMENVYVEVNILGTVHLL